MRLAPLMTYGIAVIGTGVMLAVPPNATSPLSTSTHPSAPLTQQIELTASPGGIVGQFIGFFISNGTADHPNAGLLLGNGYSYGSIPGDCPSAPCNGGNAGLLLGDGGNGFGGGRGGNAALLGLGNGGDGANGVDAIYSRIGGSKTVQLDNGPLTAVY